VRILVIGNSEKTMEGLKSAVSSLTCGVYYKFLSSGDDLEKLLAEDWDIVLSGYHMDRLNGRRALEIVRKARPDLPFVVVDLDIGEEAVAEMIRSGANDYVRLDRLDRLREVVLRETSQPPSPSRKRVCETRSSGDCDRICRSIIEQSRDGIIIVNEQGRVIAFNNGVERLSGISSDQVIGKQFRDIPLQIIPDRRKSNGSRETLEMMTDGLIWQNASIDSAEPPFMDIKRPDGTTRTIQSMLFPIETPSGTYLGNILRDVTARKQAEDAISLERSQIYRQLVEAASEGIWVIDTEYRTLFINSEMAKLLGHKPEEMAGMPMFDFVDPAMHDGCRRMLESLKNGNNLSRETELIRKDGSRFYAMLNMSPIRDSQGRVVSLLTFVANITERKKAEIALRDNESRLRSLTDSISAGILIVQGWKIVYANSAMESILGYSHDEIIEMSMSGLVSIIDPVSQKYLSGLIENNDTYSNISGGLEISFRRKDGQDRWVRLTIGHMDYDGIHSRLITFYDITERRQVEIALRDNEEKFRVLSEMITAAIIIVQDGRIIYANNAAEKITGYSREELCAMSKFVWTGVLDEGSRDFFRSIDTDQMLQLTDLPRLEIEFRRKDGSERWGEITLGIMEFGSMPATLATIFDVTERKLTEIALRESEGKSRVIFNNANDAIFLVEMGDNGIPAHIVEVNDVACQRTGLSRDQMISSKLASIIIPGDETPDPVGKLAELDANDSILINCSLMGKCSKDIPVEMNAHLFQLGDRKLVHCIVRDITERKNSQKALENNLRFLQNLIDDIPTPIFYKDANGIYTGCNTSFIKFTGRSRDQIIGKTTFDIYPQIIAAEHHDADRRIMEDLSTQSSESITMSDDGEVRHVIFYKAPLLDEYGGSTGVVGTILDITDRKIYERALKGSEEKFRSIVEQSSDGIIIVDDTGKIIEYNGAMESIAGMSRGDALRLSLWDLLFSLMSEEERVQEAYDDLKSSIQSLLTDSDMTEPIISPYIDIGHHGLPDRTIQAVIFPIMTSRGMLLGSIIRDVTERRLFEIALEKERAELKRSNEELEQFAYVASHDLQEPLRLITSYVGLLEKRYRSSLDRDALEYIQYATEAASRMQLIIKDLLLYSRVDGVANSYEFVDLENIYERTMQNLQVAVTESGATITRTSLPLIKADGIQVMQVLQNLISNAIKYRSGRSPVIFVSAERVGDEWVISVKDNGIGIDPQYFHKLFTIFQRLHNRAEYPGNGIGLAMCKKIVERHGGRIWVESVPGEGSTFKFSLPASDPGPEWQKSHSNGNSGGNGAR